MKKFPNQLKNLIKSSRIKEAEKDVLISNIGLLGGIQQNALAKIFKNNPSAIPEFARIIQEKNRAITAGDRQALDRIFQDEEKLLLSIINF